MITNLKIRNFKSLRETDLQFGQLNFLIGPNASGKSNFFDALRFLQGIGNGFTLAEIIDGKPKSATSAVWEPIRGGSGQLAFVGSVGEDVTFEVKQKLDESCSWGFAFDSEALRVRTEWFGNIYDSRPVGKSDQEPGFEVRYYQGLRGRQPHLKFEANRAVLNQFAISNKGKKLEREKIKIFERGLANMQRIDPWPATLREYSQALRIDRMGDHGENFAALIGSIVSDEKVKDAYLSWLSNLRPAEVEDVKILKGAVGEPLFCLVEGDREFPAPVLSDGTLRFAAIASALFQPDMPEVMTIEEIENGIHASRLRLMVELLRNQAEYSGTQMFVTTHSPIVLSWLRPEEYRHTFYCRRDEDSGESRIVPLDQIPHFEEIVSKQPISDLFAEGWMEGAL